MIAELMWKDLAHCGQLHYLSLGPGLYRKEGRGQGCHRIIVLNGLIEDPSSTSSTHVWWPRTACNSISRDLKPSSGFQRHPRTCVLCYTYREIQSIHINKINSKRGESRLSTVHTCIDFSLPLTVDVYDFLKHYVHMCDYP